MAAVQTGHTVKKRTAGRGRAPVRRTVGQSGDRLAMQLAVCGGAFVLLVAAKVLLPGQAAVLRQSLGANLERNLDVREVFSAVGRAVSGEENGAEEVWQAVFRPLEPDAWTDVPQDPPSGTDTALPDSTPYTVGPGQAGFALDVLRQYRPGSGGAEARPRPDKESGAESGTETGPVSAEKKSGAETGSPQSDGRALPDQVNMEQSILNFDYCTPVFGTLTSGFGWRTDPIQGVEKFHYGVDLAAAAGTDILCFADGTVAAVGESTSYGKYCIVNHAGDCSTLYAHCSRITASSGASVALGEKIAEVGATGAATGPHLHLELHRGGVYLNPIYYVSHG